MLEQAISARERALCQLTVCFEFQSRSERTFPVKGLQFYCGIADSKVS